MITKLQSALDKLVHLETSPVTVKLLAPGEQLPDRIKQPKRDLKVEIAICQAVAYSRKYGWSIAIRGEDLSCPLAAATFGFKPKLEYMIEGHACNQMYTQDLKAGARTEAEVENVPFGTYEAIVTAPLQRTNFDPDLVVIYGNSAQVQRLVTAALWHEGGRINSSFSGRLDCSDEILVPLKSGKPEVVLPCYGDRVFAQTQDHEMAFCFPWNWAGKIIEGLEGTNKGGVRYPVPTFLKYTPEFPPHYNTMNEIWQEMEENEQG
ncbi:MAG: DUF169 domain-containing protein [Proteobacteria bacterium]|nr:DUF169 domain-containing protein [Pseudomonadota bacterium]